MTPEQSHDLATKIASENDYRILEIASDKARLLALFLRGGKKADPDVEQPLKLAKELAEWLRAVDDRYPQRQQPSDAPQKPDTVPNDADLPTMMGTIGREARYLKHLTRGRMGMTPNVVDARRVLAA